MKLNSVIHLHYTVDLIFIAKMENMCLCNSGGLHVGAVEDNGGKPCQAIIQLYKIQSTSDQPRPMVTGNRRRLSKGDLRLPVHRMELGRIR